MGEIPLDLWKFGWDLAELESGLPEFCPSLSRFGLVHRNLAYLSKEEARSWPNLRWSEWRKPKCGWIRAEKRQTVAKSRWFSSFLELLSGGSGGSVPWGRILPLDLQKSVLTIWNPSPTRRRCQPGCDGSVPVDLVGSDGSSVCMDTPTGYLVCKHSH